MLAVAVVGVLVEGAAEQGGDPPHQPQHGRILLRAGRQRRLRRRRLPRQRDVASAVEAAVLLPEAAGGRTIGAGLGHHHWSRRMQERLLLGSLQGNCAGCEPLYSPSG